MKLKNSRNSSRKGRPPKDQVSKYRSLLWYWSIKDKSGLSDGKLDIEFSDPEPDGSKRAYEDRIRIFESIRKSGCSISKGNHERRNFNLVARVNNHPNLNGSAAVYDSLLWDILSDRHPTLKQTTINLVKLIKVCNLNTIALHSFVTPGKSELISLSKLINLTPDKITEILELDINTSTRKSYDDILQSFSNVSDFFDILNQVDFKRLACYLNILAFYITFYRYAIFTGNFHALVSAADSINEHLFLLLQDIEWLDKDFSRGLFNSIHNRVFKSDSQKLGKLYENTLLANELTAAGENTALHMLSTLL